MLEKIGDKIQEIYNKGTTLIVQSSMDFNDSYYPFCIMVKPFMNDGDFIDVAICFTGYGKPLMFSTQDGVSLEYPPRLFGRYPNLDWTEYFRYADLDDLSYIIYNNLYKHYFVKECSHAELTIVWKEERGNEDE